jgi:hypothetical protein
MSEVRALSSAATPGPWAVLRYWPLKIVPADQANLSVGGASDPEEDRTRYAQEIAESHYDDTPGEWRARFPHRRLDRGRAIADAAFIVALVNAYRSGELVEAGEPASEPGSTIDAQRLGSAIWETLKRIDLAAARIAYHAQDAIVTTYLSLPPSEVYDTATKAWVRAPLAASLPAPALSPEPEKEPR